MEQLLSFGDALEAIKNGKLMTRKGWNGKGMFIFQRTQDYLPISFLLGERSIPDSVKAYFNRKYQPQTFHYDPKVSFTGYLCMKAADDSIVNGWLASQTDMLSNDWMEVDFDC